MSNHIHQVSPLSLICTTPPPNDIDIVTVSPVSACDDFYVKTNSKYCLRPTFSGSNQEYSPYHNCRLLYFFNQDPSHQGIWVQDQGKWYPRVIDSAPPPLLSQNHSLPPHKRHRSFSEDELEFNPNIFDCEEER